MRLIHSEEIPQPYIEAIDGLCGGLESVKILRSSHLYASIASHPDIVIFAPLGDTYVYSPDLSRTTIAELEGSGVTLIRARRPPRGAYPATASLNAIRVGKRLVHNLRCTDASVLDLARERGWMPLHVEQGYARCSTIPVGEDALITCDAGIAAAVRLEGLDVALVSPSNILLPGEEHGFIGGASGLMPDGTIVFLGDIEPHPDHDIVCAFLQKHGIGHLGLKDLPLYDGGSLIFLR